MSEFQVRGLDTDPSVHLLPQSGLASPGPTVSDLLNEAPTSKFHRRAVLISGMGFFTDAYDLFVIATVATLVKTQWHLSTTQVSWVTGSAILAAFFGAMIFGRIADVIGRKSIYVLVAVIMIIGAVTSALAPSFWVLVIARFVLGLGIGGDYPVSAVLMSEYANRKDRGRLVGLVFSMQAVGLIVGPLVALVLLSSGISGNLTWRLLLGLGALPAAGVVYLRSRMPESPRFKAKVRGEVREAAEQLETFSDGVDPHQLDGRRKPPSKCALASSSPTPQMLLLIIGTAGAWFLFDYAYYGNTLSLPSILKEVSPHATLEQKLAWSLGIFVVFARSRLPLGRCEDGPDRTPSSAAHRLRGHGRVLLGPRDLSRSDDHRCAVPAHLRAELLLRRVRTEYDHFRAALGGVSGQHAYDRSRHRCGHREARGVHRSVPRPATPTAHPVARHVARCRRSSHSRLRPHRAATRACLEEPGGDVRRGGGRFRTASPSKSVRWHGGDLKTHYPGQRACRQSTSNSRRAIRHSLVSRACP